MIWWRGNGIWALALVALIVVSAGRAIGTNLGVPLGLASAAVLVFTLQFIWDKDASAFSVPVRYWPILLLILAALAFFGRRPNTNVHTDIEVTKLVAEIQSSLPRMFGANVRLEQVSYKDKTLHYEAKALSRFDRASSESAGFEQLALKTYCDSAKTLVKNDISVHYTVGIPQRSLNDRIENYSFTFNPASCKASS